MPSISTPSKVAATRGLGAHVYFSGSTAPEREAVTKEVLGKLPEGAVVLHPYDNKNVILGQGTLALELESQAAELGVKLDAVIGPLGGGGMLSGVATALSGTGTRVYGAEPNYMGANDAQRGLATGEKVETVSTLTIADGLRTPLGDINWSVISDKEKVKGVYSVTEEQIKVALKLVIERMKVLVEPSSVVGLAVAMFDEDFRSIVEKEAGEKGWDIGIVFTGGNTTIEKLVELFSNTDGTV
jgi:threonine dehydratase